jgi:hypothetical protein
MIAKNACPVPGCSNYNLNPEALYCDRCGISRIAFSQANKEGDTQIVGALTMRREVKEMCRESDRLRMHARNNVFGRFGTTEQHADAFYQNPRTFRIGYPNIFFFRCWNCDLTSDETQPPLLPPEKYAHSTMGDMFLVGRRPNYELYEQLERELRWTEEHPASGSTRMLSGMMPHGPDIGQQTYQQMQHLTMLANQRDAETHAQNIQRIRNRMANLRPRPDAREHSPCPNCGTHFPFLLRPTGDQRYEFRTEHNYNRPLSIIEEMLTTNAISDAKPPVWEPYKDLDYFYKACKLPFNAYLVHQYILTDRRMFGARERLWSLTG